MDGFQVKRCWFVAKSLAAALVVFVAVPVSAQTAGRPMSFDVASIRQNVSNTGTCSPDQVQPTRNGIHMTNCPLLVVVGAAHIPRSGDPLGYLVQDRILAMPRELSQERYNIDAHIGDSDAEAWRDPVERTRMLHAMMQTLLAERFKLVVHREMTDKPIFALRIAKNGPKLKPAKSGDGEQARVMHPGAVAVPGGSGFFVRDPANGHIEIYGATIGTLALLLSGPAGRPVVDKTGLTGIYDMALDLGQAGLAADNSADIGPSVFSSLQAELGLKLTSDKDKVECLIIDHIERPSPN
ncbi:Protein of unknown function (DUF3738) [Terriglobus roseus DSM 18391]|uniref:Soil-associated protein, TIGR03435 family n=2 Tax=Terriglobus roseus TaxID=392734 RepID=I3ZI83_TERRK|nr:Protein of unknown function (DUF3738) [Terriglobus roseus DSM 18391]